MTPKLPLKFAAIDIGSNAVRLLLSKVEEHDDEAIFERQAFVRMPIRLSEDSFVKKKISTQKSTLLIETMIGFGHLIKAYGALSYMACATSAMREASNGSRIVQTIKKRSDLDLNIISGREEAEIIYSSHIEERLNPRRNYLYIDVGGGSTELTVISRKKVVASSSFNIGTVRLLHNLVKKDQWKSMKQWVRKHAGKYKGLRGVGSGGNINKIFKLARKKSDTPMTYKEVDRIYEYLNGFSLADRIDVLGLKPDRADVIIPASEIYLSVIEWAKIKRIYVPQVGISFGIVQLLYARHKSNK